jgi:hypothetical protein
MSAISDTGKGCRLGWSELEGEEVGVLLDCDLPSGNLCPSRP